MSAKTKPQPSAGANNKPKPVSKPSPTPAPPASSIFGMLDDIKVLDTNPTLAPLADVVPDATQHREHFDETELENLAESIREVGILLPIVVSPTGGTPPWKILDGERRWRAAKLAALEEIPIRVREDMVESNDVRHLAQLIANTNKSDLRDYEMAKAIQRELDKMGNKRGDHGRLAKLLNRPQAAISRYLSMLDPQFEPLVREGRILSADVLSRFKALDPELRAQLLAELPPDKPVTDAMVREVARKANEPAPEPTGAVASSADTPPAPTGNTAGSDEGSAGAGDLAGAAQALADGVAPAGGATEGDAAHAPGAAGDALDSNNAASLADAAGGNGTGGTVLEDEDEDDDQHEAGGPAGGASSTATAGSARGAGAPREKAVQLATTAERIEQLLRYFVDKATDRVELRVPGDLAIAIIENLGGEVPDDKDRYAGLIMELLDAKLR